MLHRLLVASVAMILCACAGERPAALGAAGGGVGPMVRYDVRHKPLPEIPLPNDSATRLDPTSATGRRLNIAEEAPTALERRLRRRANRLDGFGLGQAVTVSFDAPLDLEALQARHVGNDDPADDAFYVIRLGDGPACGGEGRARRLHPYDVGHGHYPLVIDRPCQYNFWPWEGDYICEPRGCEGGDDPRRGISNLLFDVVDEDLDGDGRLDPYEDTDYDGVLDRPNTWSGTPDGHPGDDLITFYEKETDTLILWPLVPLLEGTTYAVVLTKDLVGVGGAPVRSPFDGIHAAGQGEALRGIGDHLACWGRSLDEVAFAWTFTTGTPSSEMLALRAGLYGHGPLAEIGEGTPVTSLRPQLSRDANDDGSLPDSPYVLPMSVLSPLLVPLSGQLLETPGAGGQLAEDSQHVDYWVLGEYESPNLLIDKDGRATPLHPDDADEVFELDLASGSVTWAPRTVPFLCGVPKETEEHKAPFPVVLYGHGYSGASFEILGFAGRYARQGFALCAIEAPGHGLIIPESDRYIFDLIAPVLDVIGMRTFYENYKEGRARDLDNSGALGQLDQGTDFLVADVFHTRDNLRQLTLDQMQFIRALRAIDGRLDGPTDTDQDGAPNLLGDFDGDGVPDLGGWQDLDGDGARGDGEPDNPIYAWGQSLGGYSSAQLAALEPAVRAAAPISGYGMLTHVGLRSTNLGVPEAALLPIWGPFITFAPHLDDEGEPAGVAVGFLVGDTNSPGRRLFHVSEKIRPGDRVIVENLRTGKVVKAWAPADLIFRVGIGADALSAGEKRPVLGLTDDDNGPVEVRGALALSLGDPLRIEVRAGWDGAVREVIDSVSVPFDFQGATFAEGSPLVAIAEGLGHPRNSPDARRILTIAQLILDWADAFTFAPHVALDPYDYPYETGDVAARRAAGAHTSMAIFHSAGDSDVPVATGLALARSAGALDFEDVDERWGQTPAQVLIDTYVNESVERMRRHPQRKETAVFCPPAPDTEWRCPAVRVGQEDRYRAFFADGTCSADAGDCPGGCPEGEACFYDGFCTPCEAACANLVAFPVESVHFDVTDADDGTDLQVLPEYNLDPPLRPTVDTGGGSLALRLPYLNREGSHGVPPSIPERRFDINGFVVNQVIDFFLQDGAKLRDDPCLVSEPGCGSP